VTRPTHYFVNADGEASRVFADGYPPESLVPLPDGHWDNPKRWDHVAQEWREDLEGERTRIWEQVKAQRGAILTGGCNTPIGRVDTDLASLNAIDRLVAAALADPAGWSDVFTTANDNDPPNSDEPVDHDAMLAIKAAVVAHEQAARAAARDVRDELYDENVTTLALLYAVPTDLAERLT